MLINNTPPTACPACGQMPVEKAVYALNERGERIPVPDLRRVLAGFIVGDVVMLLALGVLALLHFAPQLNLTANVPVFVLAAAVSLGISAYSAALLVRRAHLLRAGQVTELRCPRCRHTWTQAAPAE